MLINMFSPTFVPNFITLICKKDSRNAEIDRLIKSSIMRISNAANLP